MDYFSEKSLYSCLFIILFIWHLIYKYYRRVEKNGRKDQNLIDI